MELAIDQHDTFVECVFILSCPLREIFYDNNYLILILIYVVKVLNLFQIHFTILNYCII